MAVLILARDEAAVLGRTISELRRAVGPQDRIHVVADHCTDATAEAARRPGVEVHTRSSGRAGKGAALQWWLRRTAEPRARRLILVLDADSRIPRESLDRMRRRLATGRGAVQARVVPVVRNGSPLSRLAALSEIVEQCVGDSLRARMGWPVRLRGTGMGFQRDTLERWAPELRTQVEDLELTLLLAAAGVPIHFAGEVAVLDPKPEDDVGAMYQRARWLRGHLRALAVHPKALLALLAQGPRGWFLLSSVLLKPRSLIGPLKAGLAAALWWLPGEGLRWIAWGLSLSLLWDAATVLYGVRYAPDRRAALRDLAQSPRFIAMWVRSALLSLRLDGTWLRARPPLSEAFLEARSGD